MISRRDSNNMSEMTYQQKKEALKKLLMKSSNNESQQSENIRPIAKSLLQERVQC